METVFEKDVHERLFKNSISFLKDGIERLVSKDNGDDDFIEQDLLTLTCTSFQISIELAIKALIVEREGIRCIIDSKQQKLPIEEIEILFHKNKLKTLEFDGQKNFIKSKNFITDLTREDFDIIDDFQIYRNRIVHLSYKFQEGDMYDLKYDLIYYLIHIIFKILLSKSHQDEKPSEFLEYSLGREIHKKLIHYKPYVAAMEKIASTYSENVYKCIVCNNRTYSQDEEYCYCCNFIGIGFTLINCDYCNAKQSVIYDNLNIKYNNNIAKGLCLNCDSAGYIYQCPKCGLAYNMETTFGEKCTDEKCLNDE